MQMFKKHYQICQSGTNNGEFPDKRIDKEVGVETRAAIAETYKHLRDNGFYPDGFLPNGEIRWVVQLKSECQVIMEKGLRMLEGKPMPELQQMARSGWCPLIERVKVERLSEIKEACGGF